MDGDVNLAAAIILFVRPENFVELPLEVTSVRVGGQIPTRAHSSGCARMEAQSADCFGAPLVLPFELQQSPYELFPCLLRCEKFATFALVSILVVAVVPTRTFIVNIVPPRSTARPWRRLHDTIQWEGTLQRKSPTAQKATDIEAGGAQLRGEGDDYVCA